MVESERSLLTESGHIVSQFCRSNDEVQKNPAGTTYDFFFRQGVNSKVTRNLQRVIAKFAPDVIHIHNTFPLLSSAVFSAAALAPNAALVWTVHNFRPWCIRGDMFRKGAKCAECPEQSTFLPAIKHGCYRDSRILSWPVAHAAALHRREQTYSRFPDTIIAFTNFHKRLLSQLGLPESKIVVRPHFTLPFTQIPWAKRANRIVYVGRVSQEKGIITLIRAFQRLPESLCDVELSIIGDGPLMKACRNLLQETPHKKIRLNGYMPNKSCLEIVADSKLLVVPSEWDETFGLGIIEAYARAVPVLASNLAGLPEIVDKGVTGELFDAGSPESLAQTLIRMISDDGALLQQGQNALATYHSKYTPAAGTETLLATYARAVRQKRESPPQN